MANVGASESDCCFLGSSIEEAERFPFLDWIHSSSDSSERGVREEMSRSIFLRVTEEKKRE